MVLKNWYKEEIEEDIYNCKICNAKLYPNCSQCKNLTKIIKFNKLCEPCPFLETYKLCRSTQYSRHLFYPHEYTYIGEKYEDAEPRILFLAEIGNIDLDGTLKQWYEQKEVIPDWKFDTFNKYMKKELPKFRHYVHPKYGMRKILTELNRDLGIDDICHSNLAKCANLHRRKDKTEIEEMIDECWGTHLIKELPILRPDIIIVFRTEFMKEFKKYGKEWKFLEIDAEFNSRFNLTEAQIRQNKKLVKFFIWKFTNDDSPRLIIHFNHPAGEYIENSYSKSKTEFSFDQRIEIIKEFLRCI
jgi:hypothetical protein